METITDQESVSIEEKIAFLENLCTDTLQYVMDNKLKPDGDMGDLWYAIRREKNIPIGTLGIRKQSADGAYKISRMSENACVYMYVGDEGCSFTQRDLMRMNAGRDVLYEELIDTLYKVAMYISSMDSIQHKLIENFSIAAE